MRVELTLLSSVAPTSAHIAAAASTVDPEATYLDWADGAVRQVLDGAGRPLLQIFATRAINDPHHAATAVLTPVGGYRCWTDLTVSQGSLTAGQALAHALAQATEGLITERR